MGRIGRAEEGFSLLEVLFASFIAFFVLTAVFGLLVASSTEGRQANLDVLAANLAQQVVEDARAIPYESVGTTDAPDGQPLGVLASHEETTFRGVDFSVARTVTWVNDTSDDAALGANDSKRDYKQLDVQVSWAGGHSTGIMTFLRDRTNDAPIPPLVLWTKSPPPNAVLYLGADNVAHVWNATQTPGPTGPNPNLATLDPILLQASASVVTTVGGIARMEFQVDSHVLTDPPPWVGNLAEMPAYPEEGTYTAGFPIDLAATDANGNALFPDGKRVIKVVAYNNSFGYAYQILNVTVDNTAAVFPVGSSVDLALPTVNRDRYNGNLALTWTAPTDGPENKGLPCNLYDYSVESNGAAASTWYYQDLGTTGRGVLGVSSPGTFTPSPFSAYKVTLTPRSIRGLTGAGTASSVYTLNSPQLTGSLYNQAAGPRSIPDFRYNLAVSQPAANALAAAGYAGDTVRYVWYQQDMTTFSYGGSGDLPSTAATFSGDAPAGATTAHSVGNSGNNYSVKFYFQVEAQIMSGSNVVAAVRSNVVAPPIPPPVYTSWKSNTPKATWQGPWTVTIP